MKTRALIVLLLLCVVATLPMAGCGHNRNQMPPEETTAGAATPSGPCRDDENFENGKCVPRIPRPGR